jgi:streptomycin 6-kinase
VARTAISVLRELPNDTTDTAVLCTDLHADNILSSRRMPWLAIDPKPYVGDRAFDAVQHLLNCDRLRTDSLGLSRRMAAMLDLEPARLRSWLFARCAQESLHDPELRPVVRQLAPS